MDTQESFRAAMETILKRYRETPLIHRWQEAITSEPEPKPLAFWIRESDDLVNIVWLTRRDVRDITWLPEVGMSTFNVLPLSSVIAFEVREARDYAKTQGLQVKGDQVVHVITYNQPGGLFWVPSDEKGATELSKFVSQVHKAVLED